MRSLTRSRKLPGSLARWPLVAMLVLMVGLVPGLAPSSASAAPVAGSIVVQPGGLTTIEAINARYGTRTLFRFTESTAALVQTSDLVDTLDKMAWDRSIVWFEANNSARQPAAKDDSGSDPFCGATATTTLTTGTTAKDDSGSDPFCTRVLQDGRQAYEKQWADAKIGLGRAHQRSQGQGVTIAVLDTAVEKHPALEGKTLPGLDLIGLDPSTSVPTTGTKRGHGTFVAGVALHVAPAANVLPVRVLNDDGRGSTSLVAEGIRQAAKAGAKVINMSLSTPTPSRAMWEAVAYAEQRGAILVAAYGNEGLYQPAVYPAGFTNVMSVVATDEYDVRGQFTNYGRKADIAAPGVAVVGPWRDGQYGVGSGTSYAAPMVSGGVALLVSAGVARSQLDAQPLLMATADNIDAANGMQMGLGRLDLPGALQPRGR
jgi:subtilisin family serine protease